MVCIKIIGLQWVEQELYPKCKKSKSPLLSP